ncbi:hypothetical protein EYF80_053214 [Liparis tanakae]|uniref:Uncharacterized protein n=1 Tax=Liparis tanakae TaxID=230148 RepID=A0A4Z2F644_9TELE|nr:hypothetical protein EYF80_053214 [Liparis tanakae]
MNRCDQTGLKADGPPARRRGNKTRTLTLGGANPSVGGGAYPSAGGGAYPSVGGGAAPSGGGAYPSGRGAYPSGGGAYPSGGGAYPSEGGGAAPSGGGAYPSGRGAYPSVSQVQLDLVFKNGDEQHDAEAQQDAGVLQQEVAAVAKAVVPGVVVQHLGHLAGTTSINNFIWYTQALLNHKTQSGFARSTGMSSDLPVTADLPVTSDLPVICDLHRQEVLDQEHDVDAAQRRQAFPHAVQVLLLVEGWRPGPRGVVVVVVVLASQRLNTKGDDEPERIVGLRWAQSSN